MIWLYGRNVLRQAWARHRERLGQILCLTGARQEVQQIAGSFYKVVQAAELNKLCQSEEHQGVAFQFQEYAPLALSAYLAKRRARPGNDRLVLLDGIQDPRNLGAIARSAAFFGLSALGLPRRRTAPVNAAAYKASAGALLSLDLVDVHNMAQVLEELKEQNYWVVGTAVDGGKPPQAADFAGRDIALVIGSEGEGMHDLVRKKCDWLVHVPGEGKVESLNASVAAAILIWEMCRV